MASTLQWLKEVSFLHLQQTYLAYYTFLYATVLIILVVLISYCVKHSYGNKRRLNLPPSPPKLPIIGNLHLLGAMPHLSLCYLSKKFGPIIHLQLGEILAVVVSSARLAKEVLTMDNIKAVLMDMFVAGTDTSFITLDWGMTELIMNQKAMDKAQKEIRSIMEERRTVLESDLLHMHYLKAIIKEILRLHPPAPLLLPRESMEDVTIDGYNIPAKTRFFINAWAIGRDPECWENPDTFEPERFMGSSSSLDFKAQNFELLPFGSGRRMCPGVTFGTTTIELALAQLLHSFDLELPPGIKAKDLDMTEKFGLAVEKITNLIVVAKPH